MLVLQIRNSTGKKEDRKIKDIFNIKIGFQIDIAYPLQKPNCLLMYIKASSNHPTQILKQLSQSINDRLSRNSINVNVFNSTKHKYKDPSLSINKHQQQTGWRNCQRKIIWYNPLFNKDILTNVGKWFMKLLVEQPQWRWVTNQRLHSIQMQLNKKEKVNRQIYWRSMFLFKGRHHQVYNSFEYTQSPKIWQCL